MARLLTSVSGLASVVLGLALIVLSLFVTDTTLRIVTLMAGVGVLVGIGWRAYNDRRQRT